MKILQTKKFWNLISLMISITIGVLLVIYIPFILVVLTGLLFSISGAMLATAERKDYANVLYIPSLTFVFIILIDSFIK